MKHIVHVLIADDDEDDTDLLLGELTQQINPLEACFVRDGEEFQNFLGTIPPLDLIFLDINMPKRDGIECLRWMKAQQLFRDVPVVIYTTSNHPRDKKICEELGASFYVKKPTDMQNFRQVLRSVLEKLQHG